MIDKPQFLQIFPFQVKGHRFLQILGDCVKGVSLGYYGDFQAFGHKAKFFPGPNNCFDSLLKSH